MPGSKKISDKRFWEILRANGGLFAAAARAISEETGMPYTRQAVLDRARKRPELLADIEAEKCDYAEGRLFELMESLDERVVLRAVEFYLDRKGRPRGYGQKQEVDVTSGGSALSLPQVVIIRNPHEHEQDDRDSS